MVTARGRKYPMISTQLRRRCEPRWDELTREEAPGSLE
jgi:hypothetical protein